MLPRFTFPSPLLCVSFILLSSSHGSNQPDQPKLPNDPNDQPRMSNDQPRVSNDQPKTFYIGGVLSSETTAHAFTMEAQVTIMTIIIIIQASHFCSDSVSAAGTSTYSCDSGTGSSSPL